MQSERDKRGLERKAKRRIRSQQRRIRQWMSRCEPFEMPVWSRLSVRQRKRQGIVDPLEEISRIYWGY